MVDARRFRPPPEQTARFGAWGSGFRVLGLGQRSLNLKPQTHPKPQLLPAATASMDRVGPVHTGRGETFKGFLSGLPQEVPLRVLQGSL